MEIKDQDKLVVPETTTLTYDRYLKIHELLSLQEELATPKQHDETLFIIIHQSYELWFKQILHELTRAQRLLDQDQLAPVQRAMKRVDTIQKVLIDKVNILETMAPDEFNTFRNRLNPASGFQSHQFRIFEYTLGLKNHGYLKYFEHEPKTSELLQEHLKKPSLYDSFLAYLSRQGYDIPKIVLERDFSQMHQSNPDIVKVFTNIYRNQLEHAQVYSFLESLIDLDEQFTLWRYRHMMMVTRMIGTHGGTGGSMGAQYLARTLEKKLFPEVWEVRNQLGETFH